MARQSPLHLLTLLGLVLTMFDYIKNINGPAKSTMPVNLIGSSFNCLTMLRTSKVLQSPPHLIDPLDLVLPWFDYIKDINSPTKSTTPVELVGSRFFSRDFYRFFLFVFYGPGER